MRDYDRTPYLAYQARQRAAIEAEIERLIRERPRRQVDEQRRIYLENNARLAELDARRISTHE